MFIAWGVLVPWGSFIARYLKRKGWWFNAHRAVNSLSMVLVLIGFVIAVHFTVAQHFSTPHKAIGVAVVIVGVSQPFLGTLADYWFDIKRITDIGTATPVFPDIVHRILGYVTWLLALINILLGLMAYNAEVGVIAAYIFYAGIVTSVLFGYFAYRQVHGGKQH